MLEGDAAFVEEGVLRVGSRRVSAKGWVIAAGSAPIRPAIEGLDDVVAHVITSDDVFDLASIPSSVAVVGSGSVGVELGQFLARAGARVHVVGEDDRVAGLGPGKPREAIVAALARELTLHSASRIAHVGGSRTAEGRGDVAVALVSGETFWVERILLAAGRRPDVGGLGLEWMGVRVSGGVPSHDEHLRTTNPAVFVAGDAAGAPGLLHTATLQGRAAGANAARGEKGTLVRPALEPLMRIAFCDPMVATVGLDPSEAEAAGRAVYVASRPWSQQAKARILDETEGVAQLVVERGSREIVGCQIVGEGADLLIHMVSYAMQSGGKVEDLIRMHHYHPTLAEMIPAVAREVVRGMGGDCSP